MKTHLTVLAWWIVPTVLACAACQTRPAPAPTTEWEIDNPLLPIPPSPLGIDIDLRRLPDPPTPERVRLGRWLFHDVRLSKDGTISCATCHRPQFAFSEPTPVSTGIGGQKGRRKSPSFVNAAETFAPHLFFWDGRALSLEDQALGPIANPLEMGNTHEAMLQTLSAIRGYAPYFERAFGTATITKERVARAIADYERTRLSGNSPWDRWKANGDVQAVSAAVKRGSELFWGGTAGCDRCHYGRNFTDGRFHNLGIGWDPATRTFSDEGRALVTGRREDRGAFKTPGLRDCARHAPYMHDGSIATLRDVVMLYNEGGRKNPNLDQRIAPLHLSGSDIDALVSMLEALNGEGFQDAPPVKFPQ
jgi:cytochrome c peroxidase